VPIVEQLELPHADRVRFVFPHAPSIPVTVNGGMVMPAWYDIEVVELERQPDMRGVVASALELTALLEREISRGVPAERIVVAGFSQGGAMALHVGLRSPRRLAGLIGLSSYLVSSETLEDEQDPSSIGCPIFLAHGVFDPMVPIARGQASRDRLTSLGHDVSWHEYPMEHQVCMEEIEALGPWLARRLSL
jgi:phospholipase/carboxylesterase